MKKVSVVAMEKIEPTLTMKYGDGNALSKEAILFDESEKPRRANEQHHLERKQTSVGRLIQDYRLITILNQTT
jgi:hypothetical protein